MYAVIRAGGKQYRVAPGDVIRVEKLATSADGRVSFPEVLAVSGEAGKVGKAESEAKVLGEVVEEGRDADRLLDPVVGQADRAQPREVRGVEGPWRFGQEHREAGERPFAG